jgi:hypothetical protein
MGTKIAYYITFWSFREKNKQLRHKIKQQNCIFREIGYTIYTTNNVLHHKNLCLTF